MKLLVPCSFVLNWKTENIKIPHIWSFISVEHFHGPIFSWKHIVIPFLGNCRGYASKLVVYAHSQTSLYLLTRIFNFWRKTENEESAWLLVRSVLINCLFNFLKLFCRLLELDVNPFANECSKILNLDWRFAMCTWGLKICLEAWEFDKRKKSVHF